MPSLIPILDIAPLFALYNASSTPSLDSSSAHSTSPPTSSSPHQSSSHQSSTHQASPHTSLHSEISYAPSTTRLSESPLPSMDFAAASPGTSLPVASPLTPTHVPLHARPFSHLNLWAYLALAFVMLALATIVAYCTYACYHSAKKGGTSSTSRKHDGDPSGGDADCAELNGGDEERGGKIESQCGIGGLGAGRGGVKTPNEQRASFHSTNTQSQNIQQPTHQIHYNTSKESEWPSASEDLSLDSMVESNLKRFSEAEATCNFASGIKATSEHAPKSGGNHPKTSLKPSFLLSKTDKLHKRGSGRGSKKGVSFAAFRDGMGSIHASFRSVRRSGIRGLGIGMSREHDGDGSDVCTEMVRLRTHHKHKHTDSSQPSLRTSLSHPARGSSSLEGAGSITHSSSSTGVSSSHASTHERSYAFIGSTSTTESSDETHSPSTNLLRDNCRNTLSHTSNSITVDTTSLTTSSPTGPFAGTNSTYIPFHLRPPPPSPTPAHKQNVERQYAAYRRSRGSTLKPRAKGGSGTGLKGRNGGGGGSMWREIGAELELTHSPVSPSPSPSPSFVKPIGMAAKDGQRITNHGLGLALGAETRKNAGNMPPFQSQGDKNIVEPSFPFNSNVGVIYDAHNIRFAQPPPPPSDSNGPNTPSIHQSPQMAMLWKEPKLSPISGEMISAFSGFSNSASPPASQSIRSTVAAPFALPISSPILSPFLSPSLSPTSAAAVGMTLGANAVTMDPPSSSAATQAPGQPTTPSKNKNAGLLLGLGLFKGDRPNRSPSPKKSPGKRNGLVAAATGGFSLTPTMRGPPRLLSGTMANRGSSRGNRSRSGDANSGVVSPEAARARLQTLKKLTAGS